MASFEYLYTLTATGSFEIEDIGNFAISCTNNIYNEYLLVVQTVYGRTRVLQYGPRKIDMNEPNFSMFCTYSEFDFSESKIESLVDKFVNDPKKIISQVTIISQEEAIARMKDLTRYLVNDKT